LLRYAINDIRLTRTAKMQAKRHFRLGGRE